MNIRNVTSEDLSILSVLTMDESLEHRTDICFEHSKMCIDENGDIVAAIVLRHNAVSNFYNGEMPPEEILDDEDEIGDEFLIREDIAEIDESEHYEIIGIYTTDEDTLKYLYHSHVAYENNCPIGILWSSNMAINTYFKGSFYNYNSVILLDIPDID